MNNFSRNLKSDQDEFVSITFWPWELIFVITFYATML